MPVGLYDAIWAILMDDRGASTLFTGLTLSLYGVPFILLAPFGGRLADRHGPLRTLPLAILGVIGVTVLYGALETPGILMSFGWSRRRSTGRLAGDPSSDGPSD